MVEIQDKKLQELFDTLDAYLGDTDPYFEDDWTDDEIREEYPIFWVAQQLRWHTRKTAKIMQSKDDYIIALQRMIEYHCDGKAIPPKIARLSPHLAGLLNGERNEKRHQ